MRSFLSPCKVLLALFLISPLWSQEALPQLNRQSTLSDYLAYAALNNPGLEAAFNRWKAALERRWSVAPGSRIRRGGLNTPGRALHGRQPGGGHVSGRLPAAVGCEAATSPEHQLPAATPRLCLRAGGADWRPRLSGGRAKWKRPRHGHAELLGPGPVPTG